MSETKKDADETLKIIDEILDYNKNSQKYFPLASEVHKGKSVPKKTIVERNIEESVKLRKRKIVEIEEEEKNIINCLKNTLQIIKAQVTFIENYARQKVKKMKIKYI